MNILENSNNGLKKSGKQGHEMPMLAYITKKGSVGYYIKRYLDETDASERNAVVEQLKRIFEKNLQMLSHPKE